MVEEYSERIKDKDGERYKEVMFYVNLRQGNVKDAGKYLRENDGIDKVMLEVLAGNY